MDVWVYYIVLVLSGARAGAVLVFFGIEKYIKKKSVILAKRKEKESCLLYNCCIAPPWLSCPTLSSPPFPSHFHPSVPLFFSHTLSIFNHI